ncbi:MAG: hypothetical protein Pars93KO_27370 [Parasphingorhabdus sp.]
MKRMIASACTAVVVVALSSTNVLACTAAEASEKFQKRTEQLSTPGSIPDDKIAQAWGMMNEAGTALANGDYDKACQMYDKVASDFGLSK